MIKINNSYIDRFKLTRGVYVYYISPGVYLSFDSQTLEYIEPVIYYKLNAPKYEEIDHTLNNLISKGILEVY